MAEIRFLAGLNGGDNFTEFSGPTVASGLGFYGGTFGSSVQVGQYQDSTFITSPNGSEQGPQANNTKKLASTSGVSLNGGSEVAIQWLTNQDAAINLRFTNDVPVKTQNAQLRVFDRVNKDNDPSGVTCQVAEIVHPWSGDLSPSGSATWTNAHGSGVVLDLVSSPGTSGLRPSGTDTTNARHDWYVAISPSPASVGSKTAFGLYFELQYL
jgi:hypothetical protein